MEKVWKYLEMVYFAVLIGALGTILSFVPVAFITYTLGISPDMLENSLVWKAYGVLVVASLCVLSVFGICNAVLMVFNDTREWLAKRRA